MVVPVKQGFLQSCFRRSDGASSWVAASALAGYSQLLPTRSWSHLSSVIPSPSFHTDRSTTFHASRTEAGSRVSACGTRTDLTDEMRWRPTSRRVNHEKDDAKGRGTQPGSGNRRRRSTTIWFDSSGIKAEEKTPPRRVPESPSSRCHSSVRPTELTPCHSLLAERGSEMRSNSYIDALLTGSGSDDAQPMDSSHDDIAGSEGTTSSE